MNVLLIKLIQLLEIAIIIRVVLSWVQVDHSQPWVRFLYRVTDPLLEPARRLLPPMGGIDFSPMLVLVALEIIARWLV